MVGSRQKGTQRGALGLINQIDTKEKCSLLKKLTRVNIYSDPWNGMDKKIFCYECTYTVVYRSHTGTPIQCLDSFLLQRYRLAHFANICVTRYRQCSEHSRDPSSLITQAFFSNIFKSRTFPREHFRNSFLYANARFLPITTAEHCSCMFIFFHCLLPSSQT